jgi:hypothetical protein
MSKQKPPDDERVDKAEIVFELRPHRRARTATSDTTALLSTVTSPGSGRSTRMARVEDIVFFASPRWLQGHAIANERKDGRGERQR